MSIAVFDSSSLAGLAARLGASPQQLNRNQVDLADARATAQRLAGDYARRDAELRITRSEAKRLDDVTTFLESTLSVTLAPVQINSNRRYLFAPGYASSPLIPVANRAPAMADFIRWGAYTESGEAIAFAPSNVESLRFVGQQNDMVQQPLSWYGVAVKTDPFEVMREQLLRSGSKLTEDMATAGRAMADYAEQVGSWGISSAKIPGFFTTGACMSMTLEYDPGSPSITAEQLNEVLIHVNEMWYRANPMSAGPSGVVLPRRWWANWTNKFFGVNGEGAQMLATLKISFPWLNNPVLDNRIAMLPNSGKAFMQLFSGSGEDQYFEAMTPMVMGPYPVGVSDVYYFVAQTGGVVNKDTRQILRAVAP